MTIFRHWLFVATFSLILTLGTAHNAIASVKPSETAGPSSDARVSSASWDIVFETVPASKLAADFFIERGDKDILATLALALRYSTPNQGIIASTFRKLTGVGVNNWFDAQLYLETHPEIKPHPSYRALKLHLLSQIDTGFLQFLGGERTNPENMKIRLEEITWGGVEVDGIPSLDNPPLIEASEAGYLQDTDEIFGVSINGDARAYPLRIMGWHEMFNETIGGVPVALAYCTLCGSGILYETGVEGFEGPLVFGSSGFLFRSNKLMFDRHTFSLWNQFTGKPVLGPLVNSGIELKVRPVAITTWKKWREKHPETKVLSIDTGFERNYDSGHVYQAYFSSPDLMFPALVRDESRAKRKDYVFWLRDGGSENKAWALSLFDGGAAVNDTYNGRNIVLVGDEATRTVRAFERNGQTFAMKDGLLTDSQGGAWAVNEDRLTSPDGKTLARLPGAVSYWFAFENYFSGEGTLVSEAPN